MNDKKEASDAIIDGMMWKLKTHALLKGLKAEKIDEFMTKATEIDNYESYGETYFNIVFKIKQELDCVRGFIRSKHLSSELSEWIEVWLETRNDIFEDEEDEDVNVDSDD